MRSTESSNGAGPPLRVLLLCNYDLKGAATVSEHIRALSRHSENDVFTLSSIGEMPERFPLEGFDVVVIHYSVFVALDAYLGPRTRRRLRAFPGLKAAFIQDEYRFVDKTVAAIEDLGIGLVFTCVDPTEWSKVYPSLVPTDGVRLERVLTGYASDSLTLYEPLPLSERPISVGYRGRVYPMWHGNAGREKSEIGRRFAQDAERFGLTHDIALAESDRLYGRAWIEFMQRCRSVLAVESGCSMFDFDGTLSAKVETISRLRGADFSYDEARTRFLADREDEIDLYQISPRVFEAAALRTMLVMYEGRYSSVMEPWRHYVPLKKDHSNMAEVAEAIRDDARCAEIIANAYAEVALNPAYSYKTFVRRIDALLESESKDLNGSRPRGPDLDQVRERYPLSVVDDPHGLVTNARDPALLMRAVLGRVRRRFVRRTLA
jgi:hypothetical protein